MLTRATHEESQSRKLVKITFTPNPYKTLNLLLHPEPFRCGLGSAERELAEGSNHRGSRAHVRGIPEVLEV